MKIRRPRILAGMAVIALSFSIVACSDTDDGTPDASDTQTPTQQATESPTAQTTSTEESATPDTQTPSSDGSPTADTRTPGTQGSASPGAANSGDTDLATATFALSWQDAVELAQQNFQGDLTSVDLDWDDGRWAYTVELISGSEEYEVDIDADTGEMFDEERDDEDDDDDEIVDIDRVIPLQDAIDAALAARDGRIEEWKLDGTDRGAQFEFDIDTPGGGDVEVDVDAYTGEVLSVDD